jgi:hypothetical protein
MNRTTCHLTVSLDGFLAGPNQDRDNAVLEREVVLGAKVNRCEYEIQNAGV